MDLKTQIKITANNALCFEGDDSEHETALYIILELVAPELFEKENKPKLEYIDFKKIIENETKNM